MVLTSMLVGAAQRTTCTHRQRWDRAKPCNHTFVGPTHRAENPRIAKRRRKEGLMCGNQHYRRRLIRLVLSYLTYLKWVRVDSFVHRSHQLQPFTHELRIPASFMVPQRHPVFELRAIIDWFTGGCCFEFHFLCESPSPVPDVCQ